MAYGLVDNLSKADVGVANKKQLNDLLKEMDSMDVADMYNVVPVCRLEKAHDEQKVKLVLCVKDLRQRTLLRKSMAQLGHTPQVGRLLPATSRKS